MLHNTGQRSDLTWFCVSGGAGVRAGGHIHTTQYSTEVRFDLICVSGGAGVRAGGHIHTTQYSTEVRFDLILCVRWYRSTSGRSYSHYTIQFRGQIWPDFACQVVQRSDLTSFVCQVVQEYERAVIFRLCTVICNHLWPYLMFRLHNTVQRSDLTWFWVSGGSAVRAGGHIHTTQYSTEVRFDLICVSGGAGVRAGGHIQAGPAATGWLQRTRYRTSIQSTAVTWFLFLPQYYSHFYSAILYAYPQLFLSFAISQWFLLLLKMPSYFDIFDILTSTAFPILHFMLLSRQSFSWLWYSQLWSYPPL
jgi:hypothetical protein